MFNSFLTTHIQKATAKHRGYLSKQAAFQPSQDDLDRMYEAMRESYIKETGQAWDKSKFLQRANSWDFYGNPEGFIATRPQNSGLVKLVATAGNPKGVLKGIKEIQQADMPVWGAVSDKLVPIAKKYGMLAPHETMSGRFLIRNTIPKIPAHVFGGTPPVLLPSGGLQMNYPDVGKVTKYMVVSPQYLKHVMASSPYLKENRLLEAAVRFLLTKKIQ